RVARRAGGEADRGEHGSGPGAEVLRAERLAAGVAQIAVDVGGADRLRPAVVGLPLEEVLAGQVLATTDDGRDAPVGDRHAMEPAALAAEREAHAPAVHVRVLVAQRGEAEGVVLPRVLLVTVTQERRLEEADDGGN